MLFYAIILTDVVKIVRQSQTICIYRVWYTEYWYYDKNATTSCSSCRANFSSQQASFVQQPRKWTI